MSVAGSQGLSLELQRVFEAPPQRVFEAWTDAGQLQHWFGPPGCRVKSAQVDLRPDGELRIDLLHEPSGLLFPISGVFRIVEPPRRLVCTWIVQTPDRRVCSTLLSVEFAAQGQGTLLRLRQELLLDEQTLRQQQQVMESCLKQLGSFLEEGLLFDGP